MAMPRGATAVDFAYAVHTDIGNRCVAAQDQLRAGAAAHRAEERRPRRDHHRAARASESGVAVVRQDRQGALADPPLPQDHAVRGVGGAGRAPARPGAARPRRASSREVERRALGASWCATSARNRARRSSPTSAWASASPPSSRASCSRSPSQHHGRRQDAAGLDRDPRLRRHGGAVRQLLQPDPRRPHHRLHQEGPGPGRAHPRLPDGGASRAAIRTNGWTSNGRRTPSSMFDVGIRVDGRSTSAACWRRSPRRSPTPARNIDNVSMDEERSLYTTMHFTLQVANRLHLARVMRSLRRIQEVVRIARVQD